jgi:hypothetical protein
MRTGTWPAPWRLAIATPLPKPGKDTRTANGYRPVQVEELAARIAERIIEYRIKAVVTDHDSQYGFRRGVPLDLPLASAVHRAVEGFSRQTRLTQQESKNRPRNQHKTIMVALDLSDAFCRIRGPRVAAFIVAEGKINREAVQLESETTALAPQDRHRYWCLSLGLAPQALAAIPHRLLLNPKTKDLSCC